MLDDLIDPEIVVAVAATSAVFSSRARHWLQRGAVYGVAGALIAGDALATLGRGVARGMRERIAELPRGSDGRAPATHDDSSHQPAGNSGSSAFASTQNSADSSTSHESQPAG